MKLTLTRFAYLPDCTLGRLVSPVFKLATLEEAWRPDPDGPGGQRRETGQVESCVPDGIYDLRPHVSPKYPEGVYCIVNPNLGVYAPGTRPIGQKWGRDAILIHAGNTTADIEGCILVGLSHTGGTITGGTSRTALTTLKTFLGSYSHTLEITPYRGTTELRP